MLSARAWRNLLMGAAGIGVGALFMTLALRGVEPGDLARRAAAVDRGLLARALAVYWTALVLRVLRWHGLVRQLGPVRLVAVGETLLVGYAVNNLLPARLGEVARAAYAKRRLAIGRARIFGTIVIERLLDLGAILGCLLCGLIGVVSSGHARLPAFELVALNAGAVVGLAVLGLALLRSGALSSLPLPQVLHTLLADFSHGTRSLNRTSLVLVSMLTLAVWACEVVALASVFAACGATLAPAQALLVMGAASLSTLVPTAPGYLGTYQLVAVLALQAFGLEPSPGIVATGAIQLVLFGSVTVAGCSVLVLRGSRHAWRAFVAGPVQSSSEKGVKSVSRSK